LKHPNLTWENFEKVRAGIDTHPSKTLWAIRALDKDSDVAHYYRVFGADIDGDLGRLAKAFPTKPSNAPTKYHLYYLKHLWRFLLRRYAFREAKEVGRVMRELGEERGDRVWRLKDPLLPRLAVAVFAGFLVLASSSTLLDILWKASTGKRSWVWFELAQVAMVYALAVADVQKRISRRPWRQIFSRAGKITVRGLFYGFLGGALQSLVGPAICWPKTPAAMLALCSLMAVVLGFTLQLFWQEGSIGDPL
jgi:hypothetical protein